MERFRIPRRSERAGESQSRCVAKPLFHCSPASRWNDEILPFLLEEVHEARRPCRRSPCPSKLTSNTTAAPTRKLPHRALQKPWDGASRGRKRTGQLSCFCPAQKSKNFVSRARTTPLRSVVLSRPTTQEEQDGAVPGGPGCLWPLPVCRLPGGGRIRRRHKRPGWL